jgi:hypothetical protein
MFLIGWAAQPAKCWLASKDSRFHSWFAQLATPFGEATKEVLMGYDRSRRL